jgi:crotonobetainyl-CoA:carnitine CoA-transferase CaiB-like acyl-CoA transferase
MNAPLTGVRIIDLTELLPGPYATQLFVDLGAEVIKIERPGTGDGGRTLSPGMFAAVNRGKYSVCLDLKQDAGRAVLHQLAAQADVLIEGYRPGVTQRLGVDYASLRALNPRLIYVSLTGYGQTGPLAQRPGHDINFLAAAGIIGLSGVPDGPPVHSIGAPVGDLAGSMFAVVAVLGALLQRQQSGEGQFLDVSITDALVSWMAPRIGVYQHGHRDAAETRREILTRPAYGVFATADEKYLTLAALETPFWKRLVQVLELPALAVAELDAYPARVAKTAEIATALSERLRTRPLAHWAGLLAQHDIPFSTVPDIAQVLDDPHFRARGLFGANANGAFVHFPVAMNGVGQAAAIAPASAPKLGEHSDAVLAKFGVSAEDISRLHKQASSAGNS